jgi:glutathione S-transferase
MKLYEDPYAPNPRRVRIFLAEKGISVPTQKVNIVKGEHKTEWFRKISPAALLPALELDDGRTLTETVAICRYFEAQQLAPPLMGVDATDCAFVEMWQRRMELELFLPIGMSFRHTSPMMAALEEQNAAWGETCRTRALKRLKVLDRELADRPFIAGERYTIADITALCAIDFGRFAGIDVPAGLTNVQRWYAAVSGRPSAQAQ